MRAPHHDRKVPHVHFPFVLEVNVQLVFRHQATGEGRPSPVRFSFHLLKQRLLELGYVHSFSVGVGRVHVENARKSGRIQASPLRYV